MKGHTLFAAILFLFITVYQSGDWHVLACNESVCASIVSKCMLTQSCKCDLKTNATCSKDCFYCLDYLYTECCSCVELCPQPNETDTALSSKSHVEDILESSPELFNVLTEEKDRLLRWTSFTFPVQVSFVTSSGHDKEIKFDSGTKVTFKGDGVDQEEDIQANCTVAYMSQCMSWNKCRSSCRSMGASSYRWFHDGCCQCVGANCVNYGINESRCLECTYGETGEDSEMAIDEPPPNHTEHEDTDGYEIGPGHEEEDSRQDNSVPKVDEEEEIKHQKETNPVPKKAVL
ncbi:Protein twisted gastrulation [Halotydeus destructor]|nr:Protein twisted gastrulation [Halotydeus destructor]